MNEKVRDADRVILGIDPGTNYMGYGVLGVKGKTPYMIAMGILDMHRMTDPYLRLGRIFERVQGLATEYCPDEMAIEAPFFGKNVQSMLKLGRAQGVAIAAAMSRQVPVTEYEPRSIKLAITGNGGASKEQVSAMLCRILAIPPSDLPKTLDSTDALAAALCHFYESSKPIYATKSSSWKDFIRQNPDKVSGL